MPKSQSSRNETKEVPPQTGLPAAISQGTAATDNLAALIKNNVIVVNVQKVDLPSNLPANEGTLDTQQDS